MSLAWQDTQYDRGAMDQAKADQELFDTLILDIQRREAVEAELREIAERWCKRARHAERMCIPAFVTIPALIVVALWAGSIVPEWAVSVTLFFAVALGVVVWRRS